MSESPELRPEQVAALEFIRRHGTEAPAESVRATVARAVASLDSLLAPVDEATARRKPDPESWSIQEVVDHLIVSHRPAGEQLAAALRRGDPGGAVPAGLQSEDPFELGWDELRRQLGQVHDGVVELLATADDSTPLEVRIPVAMAVRCGTPDGGHEWVEWEQGFDWKAFAIGLSGHVREHIRQVRRLLG